MFSLHKLKRKPVHKTKSKSIDAQGLKMLAQSDSTSSLGQFKFATIFDP